MPVRFHTPGGFTRFYAPLAATSLLLTSTNPLLTAAVARSADPLSALTGYLVAFSLCGVLYSPLLVMQQVAATRILEGGELAPVRRFALVLGLLLSAVAAVIAFVDPVSDLVLGAFMGQMDVTLDEAVMAMRFLAPAPFLTGIRATHQGRLIARHRTHPIAAATTARTVVLAIGALMLAGMSSGAWVGGAAFTAGLTVEAVMVAFASTKGMEWSPSDKAKRDSSEALLRFSSPLMLNVLLWWSTPLLINVVLARTADPELNIAAFGIVEAVAWFLASPVGQLQHASIALVNSVESHRKVRRFAAALSLGMFALLALLALPAVRDVVLSALYRPEDILLASAGAALPLAVLYPLLYGHRQYYQGLFIRAGCSGLVGAGAVLRVVSVLAAAIVLLDSQGYRGATFGVGLVVFGLVVEGIYLERLARSRALPRLPAAAPIEAEAVPTSGGD